MKCADVLHNLFAYSEGIESRWRSHRMTGHIARCHSCRQELEALRASRRRLTEALQEPIQAPDLSSTAMSRLGALPAPAAIGFRWAPAALAVIVLVAAAALVSHHQFIHRARVVQLETPEPVRHQKPLAPNIASEPASCPQRQAQLQVEVASKSRQRPAGAHKVPSAGKTERAASVAEAEPRQHSLPAPEPAEDHELAPKSQIMVAVVPPQEPEPSLTEIEVVDEETNTVTYCREETDEAGQVQLTRLDYIRDNSASNKERVEL